MGLGVFGLVLGCAGAACVCCGFYFAWFYDLLWISVLRGVGII